MHRETLHALWAVAFALVECCEGSSKVFITQGSNHSAASISTRPVVGHAPTVTSAARLNSATSLYDPNACRSSWSSLISSQASISILRNAHSTADSISFISLTTTDLIFGPLNTTYCDGLPRQTATGATTKTVQQDLWVERITSFDITDVPQLLTDPRKEFPSCTIHPSDCTNQFSLLKDTFRNATWQSDFMDSRSFLEDFVSVSFPDLEGFFGGCGIPYEFCSQREAYQTWTNTLGEVLHPSEDEIEATLQCRISANRLVLIHFPPKVVERDLCANDFFGTNKVQNVSTDNAVQTATLTAVTFDEHWGNANPDGRHMKLSFGGSGGFHTRSTMTASSAWTFTSPSVYLAIDSIFVIGCSQTTIRNQIISLRPDELSSYVYTEYNGPLLPYTLPYWNTRSFNLADLQGPLPAAAYRGFTGAFDESPGTIIDGAYRPLVSMPEAIRNLDPAFSNCYPFSTPRFYSSYSNSNLRLPSGVPIPGVPPHPALWDPPIALIPTVFIPTPVATPFPAESAMPAMTATPGLVATPAATPSSPAITSAPSRQSLVFNIDGNAVTALVQSKGRKWGNNDGDKSSENNNFGQSSDKKDGGRSSKNNDGGQSSENSNGAEKGGLRIGSTSRQSGGDKGGLVTGLTTPQFSDEKGELVIGSSTLRPGGSPVVINGKTINVGNDGVLSRDGSPMSLMTTSLGGGNEPGNEDSSGGRVTKDESNEEIFGAASSTAGRSSSASFSPLRKKSAAASRFKRSRYFQVKSYQPIGCLSAYVYSKLRPYLAGGALMILCMLLVVVRSIV